MTARLLFVVDGDRVRGLAVCGDALGSEGGHFAVFGNFEFGCADLLASFLQGCFVVIGVNFLDGDGIGVAGHGAGRRTSQ